MADNFEFHVEKGSIFNWAYAETLVVSFSTEGDISRRFKQYLEFLKVKKPTYILNVVQGSSSVDSVQRREAAEIAKSINAKIAVVLDSALSRGVITALSWLGVGGIKSFSPGEEEQALQYLNPKGVRYDQALQALNQLKILVKKS